jgi:site-specific recombinase XerD
LEDQFFSESEALQCMQVSPLGPYIGTFAESLSGKGYAESTLKEKIRLVAGLNKWLQQQQLCIDDLDERRIGRFLLHREKQGLNCRSNLATLLMLLQHLCDLGVISFPVPEIDGSALHHLERSFTLYLEQERGLSQATVVNYLPTIHRFLSDRFDTGAILLGELRPSDISKFILRYVHTVSPGRAKLIVTALRAFFRFLLMRGEISLDLGASVPAVANWRLSELPKSIKPEEVDSLLESCNQRNASGQRDYAVLLLLARLGLRAGEVVGLTLDDINWEVGELIIRKRKGGRQTRMPLVQNVGEALAAYIRHGRPACSTRRVFIRIKAPHVGFSSSVAICNIVRRALVRAGLEPVRKGAHLLRHSLAIRLLRNGASFAEIGEVLGHSSPNTTEIYAKVDVEALRALAHIWPGGEAWAN